LLYSKPLEILKYSRALTLLTSSLHGQTAFLNSSFIACLVLLHPIHCLSALERYQEFAVYSGWSPDTSAAFLEHWGGLFLHWREAVLKDLLDFPSSFALQNCLPGNHTYRTPVKNITCYFEVRFSSAEVGRNQLYSTSALEYLEAYLCCFLS